MTDYDPATVTIVRTPFDNCRVDKVLVDLGSKVKKGDPLLELFSTDLAAAKSDYEVSMQPMGPRQEDSTMTRPRWPRTQLLAKKEMIEVENNEQQSRLKMKLAKDKLLVYGLTEEEIKNAAERGRRPEGQDDLAVARRWSCRQEDRRRWELLRFQRRVDDA